MAKEYEGTGALPDDKETPGRAAARRAAAEGEVPDFREGADTDLESGEPKATPDSDEGEGSTPEPTLEAPPDEGEGSTPEPETFLSEVDTTDWTDEERSVLGQYKGDPREAVRALIETKRHSNEQATKLKTLEARKLPEEVEAPLATERTVDRGPSPTADEALPDTEEVQSIRGRMKGLADANTAAKDKQEKLEAGAKERYAKILKLQGKLELLQDRAKDPAASDYDRTYYDAEIVKVRQELTQENHEQLNAKIEHGQAYQDRLGWGDEYRALNDRLGEMTERHVYQTRQSKADAKTRKALEAKELVNIETALGQTVKDLGIPTDRAGRFKQRLLELADNYSLTGDIEDIPAFFLSTGKDLIEFGRPVGAKAPASYAEEKRRLAVHPAPRGAAAVATAPEPEDRPLRRRDVRRQMIREARRIPILPSS